MLRVWSCSFIRTCIQRSHCIGTVAKLGLLCLFCWEELELLLLLLVCMIEYEEEKWLATSEYWFGNPQKKSELIVLQSDQEFVVLASTFILNREMKFVNPGAKLVFMNLCKPCIFSWRRQCWNNFITVSRNLSERVLYKNLGEKQLTITFLNPTPKRILFISKLFPTN